MTMKTPAFLSIPVLALLFLASAPGQAYISASGGIQAESPPPASDSATPLQASAPGQGDVSEERADQDRIAQEALGALFSRIPGLDEVQARVDAGVASLTGTVLTLEDAELARSLAEETQGIIYVDARIREETSLRSRLGPMWERTWQKLLVAASYVPLLLLALFIVAVFFLLGGRVARWDAPYRRMADDPFLRGLLKQLSTGIVGLLGILLALELLDATALVGAVLGAAGVMGVAVGFAFRNIAENYLAGILLSLRQPFAPDDQVVVEGQEGKVVRLTSRDTILMTLDGNHVRIPNAMVFNSIILNYTRNPLRRFSFDLTVGQDQDLIRAQDLGAGALNTLEGVLSDPAPRAAIVEIGDSWVLLRFFAWANQKETAFLKVRSEAIRVVKDALEAGGISMPAPEYGLRMLEPSVTVARPEVEVDLARGADVEPGAGPGWEEEQIAPASPPPDVSPDDELDRQIARDREEAGERDLLTKEEG